MEVLIIFAVILAVLFVWMRHEQESKRLQKQVELERIEAAFRHRRETDPIFRKQCEDRANKAAKNSAKRRRAKERAEIKSIQRGLFGP